MPLSKKPMKIDPKQRGLGMFLQKGVNIATQAKGEGTTTPPKKKKTVLENDEADGAQKHMKIGKKTKIKYVKDRPGHDLRYALNSSKIFAETKWKAKVDIRSGLEKTFLWYFKNKNYFKNMKKKDILKRLGKND